MREVVIDEGWAWGVPIGGFIANFIIGGLAKSFGIIMKSTQELLDANNAPMTAAGGLIYEFMYCLSLLSIYLSEKIGCWKVIAIGATGCALSFIAAYFAQTVAMWVLAIGGGVGISLSFIYPTLFVMVGRCFRRRVGIAMGLSVAGVSVGQIAFPSLISAVIDKYGARGSYLVGAGIVCNFFITAALMPKKIIDPEAESQDEPKLPLANGKDTKDYHINSNNNKHIEEIPLNDLSADKLRDDVEQNEKYIEATKNTETKVQKKKKRKNPFRSMYKIHVAMLVMFVFSKIFGDVGDVGVAIALPLFGTNELGLNNQDISLAIAIAGTVDLIFRVFVGILSDKPWCRRSLLLLSAVLIEGFNTLFFVWFPSKVNYFIFYGVFGACSGTAVTLMTVVLTDLVGQKNLPIGFALMMFSVGLFIGAGQFLVGFIADKTYSYNYSMYYLGICLLISAALLSLEYPLKWLCFHTRKSVADNMFANKSSLIQSELGVDELNDTIGPSTDIKINGELIREHLHRHHSETRSRLSSVSTVYNEVRELVINE